MAGKQSGEITQLDVEGALRFCNGLVIISLAAKALLEIMDRSIAFVGVGEASVGNFPQVGGMRFSFDPTASPCQRIFWELFS